MSCLRRLCVLPRPKSDLVLLSRAQGGCREAAAVYIELHEACSCQSCCSGITLFTCLPAAFSLPVRGLREEQCA